MEKHQIETLCTIPTETPGGLFYIITDAGTDAVLAAGFGTLCDVRKRLPLSFRDLERAQHPDVARWQKIISAYFKGDVNALQNISVSSFGTNFQEKVWATVRTIPYGNTVSYSELAALIGSPRAVRAVGTACAHNPNILFTPCHRVVKTNGEIGTYAYGTAIKKHLLDLEQTNVDTTTNNS
jgi:methylated-DNA-[protein]-cysteine S-methyltransferase